MPSDKQSAEFMYSMLKQLELKYLDWKRVAEENGITNGHAARMRFSRYRDATEGTKPKPAPRKKKWDSASTSASDGGRPSRAKAGGGGVGGKRKSGKRAGLGVGDNGNDDDDEEAIVMKKERSGGEDKEDDRRTKRVKVEEIVKEVGAERDDEDDVPIRLRTRKEVKTEAKADEAKHERKGGFTLWDIPAVKEES